MKSANCCDDLDDEVKNEILSNSRNYKGVTISHAPICNLDTYYDLLKWTNAINSFIKCGNTKEIQQLSLIKKKQAFKSRKEEDIENMKLISYVVEALDKFTNCINTCRGMYGKKANNANNSIKAASQSLSQALQNLNENITIKPLKKLFKLVENKIKPFENKDVLEIGIATVNWCIDYNLYQQGYTALDETIKTLICVKLNLPESKDKLEPENSYINREDIANAILSGFNKETEDVRVSENLTEKDKVLIYDSINKLKEENNGEIPDDIIEMLYTNHKLNAIDTPYGTCMQRTKGKCNFAKQPPCLTSNNGSPCKDLCVGAFEGDIIKYDILINSTKNMIENAKIYNRTEMINENEELLKLYEDIHSKISQGNMIYSRLDKLKKKVN